MSRFIPRGKVVTETLLQVKRARKENHELELINYNGLMMTRRQLNTYLEAKKNAEGDTVQDPLSKKTRENPYVGVDKNANAKPPWRARFLWLRQWLVRAFGVKN